METNCASKNFMAFGGGMRFCVGTDFTKVQMAVFLHCFLTKYRWQAIGGGNIVRTPGIQFPNGFHVRIIKKDATHESTWSNPKQQKGKQFVWLTLNGGQHIITQNSYSQTAKGIPAELQYMLRLKFWVRVLCFQFTVSSYTWESKKGRSSMVLKDINLHALKRREKIKV